MRIRGSMVIGRNGNRKAVYDNDEAIVELLCWLNFADTLLLAMENQNEK